MRVVEFQRYGWCWGCNRNFAVTGVVVVVRGADNCGVFVDWCSGIGGVVVGTEPLVG